LRNQLLENQFVDLSFVKPLQPDKPRNDKTTFTSVDRMIRGTFQCWGAANDLIGHPDIEGCGAGGGVQGLWLPWSSQYEWRGATNEQELRVNLLLNRRIRAPESPPLTRGTRIAGELWSYLPREGRATFKAHQPIARLVFRLPDGTEFAAVRSHMSESSRTAARDHHLHPPYVVVSAVQTGETVDLRLRLKEYATTETVKGTNYQVRWKGSAVLSITPPGTKMPLYANREWELSQPTPMCAPRYP
jgi:hypothetical protein